jgi:hypothetical protein
MKQRIYRLAWLGLDIVRGVCLGALLCYAIYVVFLVMMAGPVFRYAGY